MQALESVDEGKEATTSPEKPSGPVAGEEPDARPEGPLPEPGVGGVEDEKSDPKNAVLSWAKSIPEGSHLDFEAKDWWDPETGGKNRLAFHLSNLSDEGAGYPNGVGTLVAIGEMYYSAVLDSDGEESGEDTEGLV
jgi:hypothetical protein